MTIQGINVRGRDRDDHYLHWDLGATRGKRDGVDLRLEVLERSSACALHTERKRGATCPDEHKGAWFTYATLGEILGFAGNVGKKIRKIPPIEHIYVASIAG